MLLATGYWNMGRTCHCNCFVPERVSHLLLYCDAQIEEEYMTPGSQKREALGKMPQMWGQSLYVLASLVKEVSVVASH